MSATHGRPDEAARRAYWADQMDAAYDFMETIRGRAVEECGESLASLRDAVRAAHLDVAFSDTRIADTFDRIFYLREGLIHDFLAVAKGMNDRGWVLKVEDAYRSRAMQTALLGEERVFDVILRRVLWERDSEVPDPETMLRRVSALIATRPNIGTHMSGSALDISVLRRDSGRELDRGGSYIELSEKTPMASPFISAEAREKREAITAFMQRRGFAAYPYEFWHYSKGDAYEGFLTGADAPARYGAVDADLDTGQVTPTPSPDEPLHTLDKIQRRIEEALERLKRSEQQR